MVVSVERCMKKKRILVVDDQSDFAPLLQRAMPEYEMRAEEDCATALQIAARWRPDLVLLDLIMPDMHGIDLAAKIAADDRLRGIPIVFLSALVQSKDDDGEPVLIGGYPAFGKPFQIEALRRHIALQLSSRFVPVASLGMLKEGELAGQ